MLAVAALRHSSALLYYPRHWRASPSPRRKPLRRLHSTLHSSCRPGASRTHGFAGCVSRRDHCRDDSGERPRFLEPHLPAARTCGMERLDADGPDLSFFPFHRRRFPDAVICVADRARPHAARARDSRGAAQRADFCHRIISERLSGFRSQLHPNHGRVAAHRAVLSRRGLALLGDISKGACRRSAPLACARIFA